MSYPCLSLAVKFMCRPLFFVDVSTSTDLRVEDNELRQNRYLNIEVTIEE